MPTVTVTTTPDGNCGCHAIHAIIHRDSIDKDFSNLLAKIRQREQVALNAATSAAPAEGLGGASESGAPDLELDFDRFARFRRLLENEVPPETVKEMMLKAGIEAGEARFLKDMKKALSLYFQPLYEKLAQKKEALDKKAEAAGESTADLEAEIALLQKEWEAAKKKVKDGYEKYEARSKKKIGKSETALNARLAGQRAEWMDLMSQLVGTHVPSGKPYRALRHRHDAALGAYGRAPSEEDALVAHRHLEVLHGHGGWYRTGLLSEGNLTHRMRGLTSAQAGSRSDDGGQVGGEGAGRLHPVEGRA